MTVLRGAKTFAGIALAGFAMLAAAAPAMAAHHLVKVREVFPGTVANPGAEFVELQLSQAGENQLFTSTSIQLYGPTGTLTNSGSFPGNPANGANQRFVLASTAASQTLFTVAPELTLPAVDAMDPLGGAACFESTNFGRVDCVAWGNFTNPPVGSNAGSPESPAGIPNGSSIKRRTSAGCLTSLDEFFDDVNDSDTDFTIAPTPVPENNASTPAENPCVLQVSKDGTGTGTVTGTGINCGGDCDQAYTSGGMEVLTATPSAGSAFAAWSGSCLSTTGNQCTVLANNDAQVTATFDAVSTPPPTGGGTTTPVTSVTPVTPVTPAPKAKKCKKAKKRSASAAAKRCTRPGTGKKK